MSHRYDPPREFYHEWTSSEMTILKQRFGAGDTYEQIAKVIGGEVNKNMVAAKRRRMGLSRRQARKLLNPPTAAKSGDDKEARDD